MATVRRRDARALPETGRERGETRTTGSGPPVAETAHRHRATNFCNKREHWPEPIRGGQSMHGDRASGNLATSSCAVQDAPGENAHRRGYGSVTQRHHRYHRWRWWQSRHHRCNIKRAVGGASSAGPRSERPCKRRKGGAAAGGKAANKERQYLPKRGRALWCPQTRTGGSEGQGERAEGETMPVRHIASGENKGHALPIHDLARS